MVAVSGLAWAAFHAPLIVFLHEGLGSLSMWREFPKALCDAAGVRGLVYSRPGYGRSTPRAPEEAWDLDFMHRQAHEVLPALLEALDIDDQLLAIARSRAQERRISLGAAVFVLGGWPFVRGAWRELADRRPGMMTLIAWGSTTNHMVWRGDRPSAVAASAGT